MRTLKENLCSVKLQGVAENLLTLHIYGNAAEAVLTYLKSKKGRALYKVSSWYICEGVTRPWKRKRKLPQRFIKNPLDDINNNC